MSLLGNGETNARPRPVRDTSYNSDWVYGPAGGITPSEINEIKEQDGRPRCQFCRQVRPLQEDGCCDAYCSEQQHGWVPWGKIHPHNKTDKGREWYSF